MDVLDTVEEYLLKRIQGRETRVFITQRRGNNTIDTGLFYSSKPWDKNSGQGIYFDYASRSRGYYAFKLDLSEWHGPYILQSYFHPPRTKLVDVVKSQMQKASSFFKRGIYLRVDTIEIMAFILHASPVCRSF